MYVHSGYNMVINNLKEEEEMKTVWKKTAALVMVLMMIWSLAGCGSSGGGESSETTESKDDSKKVKIGFVVSDMSDAFFAHLVQNMQADAEKKGVTLTVKECPEISELFKVFSEKGRESRSSRDEYNSKRGRRTPRASLRRSSNNKFIFSATVKLGNKSDLVGLTNTNPIRFCSIFLGENWRTGCPPSKIEPDSMGSSPVKIQNKSWRLELLMSLIPKISPRCRERLRL